MNKNFNPHQIAGLIGIGCSLVTAILSLILLEFNAVNSTWTGIFIFSFVILLASYLISLFFIKRYLYRKIKLIYKTIFKHKLSDLEKKSMVRKHADIISDMEIRVADWAQNRENEIALLKANEDFRRNFVGDVSHELKTPLFNIQGYIDTILDENLSDPEQIGFFLERASKNVERLINIVDDLIIISKLESNKLQIEPGNFEIKKLVREVFEELDIYAKKKGIKLGIKDNAKYNFTVKADRNKIRQVLINLLQNAINYGNENGNVKIGFYDMDKRILVEVADDGIGIPHNEIPFVFNRFYRVDKSRSRDKGGTGLGLSIVKHIIEAHNQTINVRSTENLGTTFGFTLQKA